MDIRNPGQKNCSLWKYSDLHGLLFFLSSRNLFFTRLDYLEDPFEGVASELLLGQKKHTGKKTISFDKSFSRESPGFSQKNQYVNCWFYGERESMAMWNLYSNQNSVAIKISLDDLTESVSESFREFVKQKEDRFSVLGDRVKYYRINPLDKSQKKNKISMSAFIKDSAYEHENEYRFLVYPNKKSLISRVQYLSIPLNNFNLLPFEIITHPNMEEWKFKNIVHLLKILELDFKLCKASTILR